MVVYAVMRAPFACKDFHVRTSRRFGPPQILKSSNSQIAARRAPGALAAVRRAAALVLALASPVSAWNDTGHMVVAEIARRTLSEKSASHASALLKLMADLYPENSTFVKAGPWPDVIRDENPAYGPWHFIDKPINAAKLPSVPEPDPTNAVWALEQCVKTFRMKKDTRYDRRTVPEWNKAHEFQSGIMLRWFIHLAGDIHQPLHCAARFTQDHPQGDHGGNLFKMAGVEICGENVSQLHTYWDWGAGVFPPQTCALKLTVEQVAREIMAAYPASSFPELQRIKSGDWLSKQDSCFRQEFDAWAQEGFAIAGEQVYRLQEGSKPSDAYAAGARETARKRAALAGYRLALMLNVLLPLQPARDNLQPCK